MADKDHFNLICNGGVEKWNVFVSRQDHGFKADFTRAHLAGLNLSGANFTGATFTNANLSGTDLTAVNNSCARFTNANLSKATIFNANFSEADLSEANLSGSNLIDTKFIGANLSNANLSRADLTQANLTGVNLIGAKLFGTCLQRTKMHKSNLSEAEFGTTSISDCDLAEVLNLNQCFHHRPSTIGTDTLLKSKGNIPEKFLAGCGLQYWEITGVKLYKKGLNNKAVIDILYEIFPLRGKDSIQYYSTYES